MPMIQHGLKDTITSRSQRGIYCLLASCNAIPFCSAMQTALTTIFVSISHASLICRKSHSNFSFRNLSFAYKSLQLLNSNFFLIQNFKN